MAGLIEFSIAIARIILGVIALIGGLIILDIVVYLSAIGGTFTNDVSAAYHDGFGEGHAATYGDGYREAYGEAYDRGLEKGYEMGRRTGSEEGASTRVGLHNPTDKELREFLTRDTTDSNPFIKGEYVCFDFAAELNNNAEASGIRAAYVRIHAKEWGHAVVAFETVDRGLIFIEPQSDNEVELVKGEAYPWQQVGAVVPRNYYEPIDEIQIIW